MCPSGLRCSPGTTVRGRLRQGFESLHLCFISRGSMKVNKNIFQNCIFSIAFSLLVFMFAIYLLTSLGFIVGLKVNIFYPIISLLISYGSIFWCLKAKNSTLSYWLICVLIETLLIILSACYSAYHMDWSYDGIRYHQTIAIYLANGWNPIYQLAGDFADKFYSFNINTLIWVQTYPKFSEIIASNIFKLTGNIEAGKIYNIIPFFILFFYSFYVFNKKAFCKINIIFKLLFAFIISFNPFLVHDLNSFLNDGLLNLLLTVSLLAILDFEISKNNKFPLFLIIMSSACAIGVKLGGFYYSVFYFLIYFVYLLVVKNKIKIKYLSIAFLIILLVSILCNINPYITNVTLLKKHPLHPLAGNEKIDFITKQIPNSLKDKNHFQKFYVGIFSRNHLLAETTDSSVINPFDLNKIFKEYRYRTGFGIFFPEILIIAIVLSMSILFYKEKNLKIQILMYSLILIPILINPHLWMARYISQFYLFPIFLLLFNPLNNKHIFKVMLSFLFILFIFNSYYPLKKYNRTEKISRRNINKILNSVDKNSIVEIYPDTHSAFLLKLFDRGISYQLVGLEYIEKNKDRFVKIPDCKNNKAYWSYKIKE